MSKENTNYVDFKTVKEAVSITQILEHYELIDALKISGDVITGACPLHGGYNKTSFRVSISKNCWNCFGKCQRGGNILDFVSLKEEVNIREAAVLIAKWFDVTQQKPEAVKTQPKGQFQKTKESEVEGRGEKNTVKENTPLTFALKNLDPEHAYLSERGLTPETIATFGLGYCEKGSMAHRIAIPIADAYGRLVAYAGRWPGDPPDNKTPKYKVPKGFKKSLELFNYHRALVANREQPLVICEGFFGCLNIWQSGYPRVVALMGSTLSPEQHALICALADADDRIILILDEDDAGRAGREKITPKLAHISFVKTIVFANEGMSPDTMSAEDLFEFLT